MPMPLPEERVYYFELRECGNVLLCWIPRHELEAGAANGTLDGRILEDYPHGLDVEVTPTDTGYLRKRYGFELGSPPADLLLAFEAIAASNEVEIQGEVRGTVVDELARRSDAEDEPAWDDRRPISKDQAEVVLKRNPAVQMRVDRGLRKLRRKSRAKSRRPAKVETAEILQRIRRTKGESPATVFTRLQRQVVKGDT